MVQHAESADEELAERRALDLAIATARNTFTMIEAGAAYGRWVMLAHRLMQERKPSFAERYICVEADPGHVVNLRHNIEITPIPNVTVIERAMTTKPGPVYFTSGHNDEWFGQAIIPSQNVNFGNWPRAAVIKQATINLRDVLRGLGTVDYLDMDIQGAEEDVIPDAIEAMTQQVRVVHIGTHSEAAHTAVGEAFKTYRWKRLAAYPPGRRSMTDLGPVDFQDGVHYWVNARPG